VTTNFSRVLARSVIAPYVAVFTIVLAIFVLGVHLAVAFLSERQDSARLETLARASITVVDSKGQSFDIGEQADSVAGADQRVVWFDRHGRVVATRGASASAMRSGSIVTRTAPISDDRGRRIGTVQVMQNDELHEHTLHGVDLGLAFGFVLATLTGIAGGSFLSRKSIARIGESVRSLEEFSANAAHELRTPLAAIIANAEASLRAGTLGDVDAHRVATVVSTATSMRRISDDLLTLATAGTVAASESHRIDVEEVVTSALALVAPLADRGGIVTRAQIEGAPWVVGRPEHIERIVVNLVENAVRYTRPGGRVVVIAREERGAATIVVSDTGIGITSADRQHIFERFWRADAARRVGDGSGLGLAIVATLVARHAGTIAVESGVDAGSTFTVRLPQMR